MRLLATFQSAEEGYERYLFLLKNKIACQLEKVNGQVELWITSEDQFEQAKALLSGFTTREHKEEEGIHKAMLNQPPTIPLYFRATLTKLFVAVCVLIFIVSLYQYSLALKDEKNPKEPFFPVLTKIQQELLYDLPPIVGLMDQFNQKYSLKSEKDVKSLPPDGQALFEQITHAPTWQGIYPKLVGEHHPEAPLFIKIREGEVWRIFTPIFLHANVLHILFNMLWLWLLGKMMEHNIGAILYLLFVAFVAVVTNTLQYLISGPFFMGFSGLLAGMAGFIWVRKKKAPWEFYAIDSWVLKLLGIFIFGLLGVQIVVFILRILHITTFDLPFANAAHIVGAFLGMGCGCMRMFRSK